MIFQLVVLHVLEIAVSMACSQKNKLTALFQSSVDCMRNQMYALQKTAALASHHLSEFKAHYATLSKGSMRLGHDRQTSLEYVFQTARHRFGHKATCKEQLWLQRKHIGCGKQR